MYHCFVIWCLLSSLTSSLLLDATWGRPGSTHWPKKSICQSPCKKKTHRKGANSCKFILPDSQISRCFKQILFHLPLDSPRFFQKLVTEDFRQISRQAAVRSISSSERSGLSAGGENLGPTRQPEKLRPTKYPWQSDAGIVDSCMTVVGFHDGEPMRLLGWHNSQATWAGAIGWAQFCTWAP